MNELFMEFIHNVSYQVSRSKLFTLFKTTVLEY